MKLHSKDRVAAMLQAHNFGFMSKSCANQNFWQWFLYNQLMITSSFEGACDPLKDTLSLVIN